MAKIPQMPALEIIKGFKGIVDFYTWRGLVCARKWPYTPPSHFTPASIAARADFAYVMSTFKERSLEVDNALKQLAAGSQQTALDYWRAIAYDKNIRIDFP